jgi:hypothetical protein
MGLGDVVNELHDKDSFAHPCTTKETNFTSSLVGCKEIHNLIEVQVFALMHDKPCMMKRT